MYAGVSGTIHKSAVTRSSFVRLPHEPRPATAHLHSEILLLVLVRYTPPSDSRFAAKAELITFPVLQKPHVMKGARY